MQKIIYIVALILIMLTQTLHTWKIFMSFSKLEKSLKIIQGIAFCSIFSILTLAFAIDGKKYLAGAMAFIEVGINIYYYFLEWWQNGYGKKGDESRRVGRVRFWRRNWIVLFAFAIIIPALIFILSDLLQ